jgi:hypothetical protein
MSPDFQVLDIRSLHWGLLLEKALYIVVKFYYSKCIDNLCCLTLLLKLSITLVLICEYLLFVAEHFGQAKEEFISTRRKFFVAFCLCIFVWVYS